MRTDIAKVTTERPRHGHDNPSRKYAGRVPVLAEEDEFYEDEHGGFYTSGRKRQHGGRRGHGDFKGKIHYKEFSDFLSPLRGALRKNVGRLWDDVYSDFMQHLDLRKNAGIHIHEHLLDYVTRSGLYVGENEIVYSGVHPNTGEPQTGFFVHPHTGLLCFIKRRKFRHFPKPWEPITEIHINSSEYFKLIEVGKSSKARFKTWFYFRIVYEPRFTPLFLTPKGKVTTFDGKFWDTDTILNTPFYINGKRQLKENPVWVHKKTSATRKQMKFINEKIREIIEERRMTHNTRSS